MKAIIFGANGQDGFYLQQLLRQQKVEVISSSRNGHENILTGNIVNRNFVESLINMHKPDYIFNFAANSSTQHDLLFENHETITTGTLNILETVYKYSKGSKIFLCGSGLQFQNTNTGIKESDPFEARDGYSIARIQSVYAARYFRRLGLDIFIGYLFNHDSPLRSVRHVNQKIAQAAKRIAKGSTESLELRSVDVIKEFSFAGDVVEAIWTLVNNRQGVNEVVIGSGKGYTIQYWVELCFGYYGLNWRDHLIIDRNFEPEYDVLVSNPETVFSLGWRPHVEIEQLVKMFCEENEKI